MQGLFFLVLCFFVLCQCHGKCLHNNNTKPIEWVIPPELESCITEKKDVCPSIFIKLLRVWDELNASFPDKMSHFVQNVGARDGISGPDPLYPLIKAYPDQLSAVLVEPNSLMVEKLRKNYMRFARSKIVETGISPSNAATLMAYESQHSMDIFKFDIDGCECHILDVLLKDPTWTNPKVIQIETNHLLMPPLSYIDLCRNDTPGRSTSRDLDVWGCSIQAAYNVVQPHGYRLLQYDWPDAVFVHEAYLASFPCFAWLEPENFHAAAFHGHMHARTHYYRYRHHQTDHSFVNTLEKLTLQASIHPGKTIEYIRDMKSRTWSKRPLWIEMAVAGTGVAATFTASKGGTIEEIWH